MVENPYFASLEGTDAELGPALTTIGIRAAAATTEAELRLPSGHPCRPATNTHPQDGIHDVKPDHRP